MHRVAPARPLKPSAPPTASRSPSSYVASGWAESLVSRTLSANSPATPSSSRRHMQPRPACIRRKRDRGPGTLPKCTFYPARTRLLPRGEASLDHTHNTLHVPNAASAPATRAHSHALVSVLVAARFRHLIRLASLGRLLLEFWAPASASRSLVIFASARARARAARQRVSSDTGARFVHASEVGVPAREGPLRGLNGHVGYGVSGLLM